MTERFNTILEELPQFMEENVEEKKFQLENDEIHNLEQYFKKDKTFCFRSEVGARLRGGGSHHYEET